MSVPTKVSLQARLARRVEAFSRPWNARYKDALDHLNACATRLVTRRLPAANMVTVQPVMRASTSTYLEGQSGPHHVTVI
jgi:hypothetical protein